jgi:hypothetical protein
MQAGYASLDDAFHALTEGPLQERPMQEGGACTPASV